MSSPVEDRLALADVVARYARAVDRRDPTVLRSLFADDAEFVQPPGLVRRGHDPVLTGAGPIAEGCSPRSRTCTPPGTSSASM